MRDTSRLFVCMNLFSKFPKFTLLKEGVVADNKRFMLMCPKGVEIPSKEDKDNDCKIYIKETLEDNDIPEEVEFTKDGVSYSMYVWKTPYAAFYRGEDQWIPILDTDRRSLFIGSGYFLYSTEKASSDILDVQIMRQQYQRSRMILKIRELESRKEEVCPIPKFVGDLIKKEAISKKDSCPISLTLYAECASLILTSCYHLFEEHAIQEWLKRNNACPMCKQRITSKRYV